MQRWAVHAGPRPRRAIQASLWGGEWVSRAVCSWQAKKPRIRIENLGLG